MTSSWTIHHVDVTTELPTLPREEKSAGGYVVFWAHEVPLGHCVVPAAQLPLAPPMLRTRALQEIAPALADHLSVSAAGNGGLPERPLEALGAHLAARSTPVDPADISVVVCTRDRPLPLRRCLDALERLAPPPREIIVVDNAPQTEATREEVAGRSGIRYVREPHPGLDVARNAGLSHSTGGVIAFTDDDVEVHPRWLEGLCRGFDDPRIGAVTGMVLPAGLDTEAQWLFEQHWGFNRGYHARRFDDDYFAARKRRGVPVWEIGAGANMAVRRSAVAAVGGFDQRLDVGAAGCSGDSEFWYRLLAEGGHCRYEPTAVVFHHHRRRLEALHHQLYHYMRGHTAALLIQHEKYGHRGNMWHLLLSLPRYYARMLWGGLRTGFQGRHGTLGAEIRGCLSGLAFYWRHRHTSPFAPVSRDHE